MLCAVATVVACGGTQRTPVAMGISFGKDPILVPDGRSISRAAFRTYVSVRLAGPWLRLRAMDKAVRAELEAAKIAAPSRQLLSKIRKWVREDELLRDWQPASQGQWRSGKAELDLTSCLASVWCLRKADTMLSKAELQAAFLVEVERRRPELGAGGAECEGHAAGAEEVYPSLLALLTPKRREELLHEAVR